MSPCTWRLLSALLASATVAACGSSSNPVCVLSAVEPQGFWARTYGGGLAENAYGATVLSNGDLLIAAASRSFGADSPWLLRVSPAGDIVWQRSLVTRRPEEARSVAATADGGALILAGGGKDPLLMKLDCAGDVAWARVLESGAGVFPHHVVETSDGGALVLGTAPSLVAGFDCLVAKFASDGAHEWSSSYGRPGFIDEACTSAAALPGGGYLVAGEYERVGAAVEWPDLWLLRLDAGGNVEVQRSYGIADADERKPVVRARGDGTFLVSATSGNFQGSEVWLLDVDDHANPRWQMRYHAAGSLTHADMAPTADGRIVFAGTARTNVFHSEDLWAMAVGDSGVPVWSQLYGKEWPIDSARSVAPHPRGGVFVVGDTASFRDTDPLYERFDIWTLFLPADGRLPDLSRDQPLTVSRMGLVPETTHGVARALDLAATKVGVTLTSTNAP
jgi:hypothetical protein